MFPIAVVSADKAFYAASDRFTYLMYFPSLPALLELHPSDDKRLEQVRALVHQADDQLADASRVEKGVFVDLSEDALVMSETP